MLAQGNVGGGVTGGIAAEPLDICDMVQPQAGAPMAGEGVGQQQAKGVFRRCRRQLALAGEMAAVA